MLWCSDLEPLSARAPYCTAVTLLFKLHLVSVYLPKISLTVSVIMLHMDCLKNNDYTIWTAEWNTHRVLE